MNVFDALADGLSHGLPEKPATTADVLSAYEGERSPYAALARDLGGIAPGARLPARGTARRSEYERVRREVRAMARGVRPSRSLGRRLLRSDRIAQATRTRSIAARIDRLRSQGGAVQVSGDIAIYGYPPEPRTMPAVLGDKPLSAAQWRDVLDPYLAGDRQGTRAAFEVAFAQAYGIEASSPGQIARTGEGESNLSFVDVTITFEGPG